MIFPLLVTMPAGFVILVYGLWQVVGLKRKEKWPLIVVGLITGLVSLGLLIFSLWVFADGM